MIKQTCPLQGDIRRGLDKPCPHETLPASGNLSHMDAIQLNGTGYRRVQSSLRLQCRGSPRAALH